MRQIFLQILNRYASIVILSLLLAAQVDAQVSGQQAGTPAKTRGADSVEKGEDPAAANPSGDIGATDTADNGERGTEPSATDEAGPATAQADTLPVEQQLETELQETKQEIHVAQEADTPERAKELGISEEELHTRVTLLQDLSGAIQKRLTSLKRLDEAKQTIVGLEKQLPGQGQVGLDLKPPYDVAMLDGLHDELATVKSEAQGDELTLKTAQASVDQADQRFQEAAQRRRHVRDQIEAAVEDTTRAGLPWQLILEKLRERIAEHELAHAKAQLQLTQLESRSRALRIELLQTKIAFVDERVVFTRRDLEQRLAELGPRRESLENELRDLRRRDEANQTRLEEARATLQSARSQKEIRDCTEAVETQEAVAQASSRGVALLQERISNLAKLKTLWERRFALAQKPSVADLAEWSRDTENMLDEVSRQREEVERQLKTLRAKKLDVENRLASWDAALGDKSTVESQLDALKNREKYATDYLASLFTLERLARRVDDEVKRERELTSWRKYWSWSMYVATYYWNRELFVIDDQAFRIGELVQVVIVFFLTMLIAWVGRIVIRRTLARHLRSPTDNSETLVRNSLTAVARRTKRTFVILIAGYLALMTLPLSDASRGLANAFAVIVLTTQVAFWANAAITSVIETMKLRRITEDPSAVSAFGLMGFFSRVAIWSAAVLLILTNLGYEIGPLLAGLGVGGVAVAFALQSILGDIFCSIAIVLDKPFIIGDFIIVNDLMGTIENIGIKTTRIRSLSGEQIIFSNADLLGSRIRNFKRMFERRVVFAFGVVYETPLEKLTQIPVTVRAIIENIDKTRFDRAHFKEYGDCSLNFEVVYYVSVPDYNVYMDIQQEINLSLFKTFQEEGIAFAYPTREIIIRPNGQTNALAQTHSQAAANSESHAD